MRKKQKHKVGDIFTGTECQELFDITGKMFVRETPEQFYKAVEEQIKAQKAEIENHRELIGGLETTTTIIEKACGKIEAYTGIKKTKEV